ncbi:MAG TPA: tRNA (adenosine(37)-N6)-threonylcarbamoyltransferase complex dimerization subunit type 1 TsaB [Gemmataceae bacterium]|nr:tRNA (adenosine(37)-N6)-threonylcarbamoyltransferase complex dimerization subunit type 1 TsaB [Gemmataceae bacterium]
MLLIETSGRIGQVGLAVGTNLLASRQLDEARRHARDLAPCVAELLSEQGWKPHDVQMVMVSRGPGSYTGLRVGIMSAKAFAFATGCKLLALDTFAVIARNSPPDKDTVEILADAQQGKVYAQRYRRFHQTDAWEAETALTIQRFDDWKRSHLPSIPVCGPGLEIFASQLSPECQCLDRTLWHPLVANLAWAGLARLELGELDDMWTVEPLYLRPSAAEEKWRQKVFDSPLLKINNRR